VQLERYNAQSFESEHTIIFVYVNDKDRVYVYTIDKDSGAVTSQHRWGTVIGALAYAEGTLQQEAI
jgi:hypothetical protein